MRYSTSVSSTVFASKLSCEDFASVNSADKLYKTIIYVDEVGLKREASLPAIEEGIARDDGLNNPAETATRIMI